MGKIFIKIYTSLNLELKLVKWNIWTKISRCAHLKLLIWWRNNISTIGGIVVGYIAYVVLTWILFEYYANVGGEISTEIFWCPYGKLSNNHKLVLSDKENGRIIQTVAKDGLSLL